MKRIIYTFVAALALVACTPVNGVSNKVRIAVSFEEEQQNSKGQQRISAVDKGGDIIDVNWEKEDVLYYQLEGEENINTASYFELVSGAGKKTAIFECNNPELLGKSFTLNYHGLANPKGLGGKAPTDPDFSNPIPLDQECQYVDGETIINNDYLVYKATDCQIGSGVKLTPQFALLGIMLTGTTENFNKYVWVGNEDNTAYFCNMNTSVSLTNSPIYYFVLPEGYDLANKNIRLAHSRGHNACAALPLPNRKLNSNEALVLKINVEYINQSTNNEYRISQGQGS